MRSTVARFASRVECCVQPRHSYAARYRSPRAPHGLALIDVDHADWLLVIARVGNAERTETLAGEDLLLTTCCLLIRLTTDYSLLTTYYLLLTTYR